MAPKIDKEACTACGVCADACPAEAITVEDCAVVDAEACTECGNCVDECPVNAITME